MLRSSFTWLFSALVLIGLGAASPAAAKRFCLPPVFDSGRRLHALPAPRVFWLELLLRQHELCRSTDEASQVRVVLLGSSSAYGFPYPAESTFPERMNRTFERRGLPVRIFNLAMVFPYQVRDALVLEEALAYRPQVVVYAMTPSEFANQGPGSIKRELRHFFEVNTPALASFIAKDPPGMTVAVAPWKRLASETHPVESLFGFVRESGSLVRAAAGINAEWLGRRLGRADPVAPRTKGRQTQYACEATLEKAKGQFFRWKERNVLAYLEDVSRRHGIDVLVVSWPVAHEPVGDCYNVRYPTRLVREFNAWLRKEAQARGLSHMDLHGYLPSQHFLDSLHIDALGHRLLALRIGQALEPIVSARLEEMNAARTDAPRAVPPASREPAELASNP